MKKIDYRAYIDGSHHAASQTSGWGFVIEKDDSIIDTAFGQIPNEWRFDFENYTLAKLIEYALNKNIQTIHIYTDAFQVAKTITPLNQEELIQFARKYVPTISIKENQSLHVVCEHIVRKYNKIADKYSRKYLSLLLKEQKNNQQWNTHPKIDFFKTKQLSYCSRTMIKSAEQKVLFAVKHDSLIVELGYYRNTGYSFLKIMKYHRKVYTTIEMIDNIDLKEEDVLLLLLQKMDAYSAQYPQLFLSLSDERKELFNQLCGLSPNHLSVEVNQHLNQLLDKIHKLFIYEKTLTNPKKRKAPKVKLRVLPLEEKKKLVAQTALLNKKSFDILIGWSIKAFKEENKRIPTSEEREVILNQTMERLQRQD